MAYYCHDMTLLQQGAEAKLYVTKFLGKDAFVKERFPKRYRLPEIDEKLTKKRISQEVRYLQRCRKIGIHTPAIYFVDMPNNTIFLEKVHGVTVREHITKHRKTNPTDCYEKLFDLATKIGTILAKLHDADIIHGDLTTSNMLIRSNSKEGLHAEDYEIYLIDFGLSISSSLAENKGVDLYVLERAFLSTHPGSDNLFAKLLESYAVSSKKSQTVLSRLDEVRLRGRKRSMVG